MSIFSIIKKLENEDFYAPCHGAVCPDCEGQIYFDAPKEDLEEFKMKMVASGQIFDPDALMVNRFCWKCTYNELKKIKEHIDEMTKERKMGIENLKIGSTLGDNYKVMLGLNQLCQSMVKFTELFEVNIILPEEIAETNLSGLILNPWGK